MAKLGLKRFLQYGLIVAGLCLFVMNFQTVLQWVGFLVSVAAPLLLGCVFAYILNVLMVRLEKIYFPKSRKKIVTKTRRPICILLSFVIIILAIFFVLYLVIPEVVKCAVVLSKDVPIYIQEVMDYAEKKLDDMPALQQQVESINIDWANLFSGFSGSLMDGTKGLLTSAGSLVGSFVGTVTNVVVGIVFAIYILACKEDVGGKLDRVAQAFMKKRIYEKYRYFINVADTAFSSFIVGQVTEAVVLGTLCGIGMKILQLEYALPIGALVGLTALIPVFGGYIGAVLGAFMLITVDPMKAVIFIIFLLILQQIEGNLIYPKVVGSSIGLPGIWVLAAIMVGGGLGGVVGMLTGVPIAAIAYKLLKDATKKKEERKEFLKKNGIPNMRTVIIDEE